MVGVYRIRNKINGKSYIGMSTVSVEKRIYKHLHGQGNKLLRNAIKCHGVENFEVEILEECTVDVIKDRERYYIKYYNTMSPNGYNFTTGGEGLEGWHFTDEIREEMSIRTHYQFLGTHHTEETKEKIRKGRLGKKHSEESKQKIREIASNRSEEINKKISESKKHLTETARKNISLGQKKRFEISDNPFKGKKHSEESKQKMSESHKKYVGENAGMYGKHHTVETKKHLSKVKSESNSGRKWYTNGSIDKFMTPSDFELFLIEHPDFYMGRSANKKLLSSTTTESIDSKKDTVE